MIKQVPCKRIEDRTFSKRSSLLSLKTAYFSKREIAIKKKIQYEQIYIYFFFIKYGVLEEEKGMNKMNKMITPFQRKNTT